MKAERSAETAWGATNVSYRPSRDAVVLFTNKSLKTRDAALKAFADKTLAGIRAHLRMAMDLRAKMFG